MNKLQFMFLNGVCGDVYGAPITMMAHEIIMQRYGLIDRYIEDTNNNTIKYSWTDDTQMTISVIDCINNENEITNENIFN